MAGCKVRSETVACSLVIKKIDEYSYRHQWENGLGFWYMWFVGRKLKIKSSGHIWMPIHDPTSLLQSFKG
jgi:hypothetical protein